MEWKGSEGNNGGVRGVWVSEGIVRGKGRERGMWCSYVGVGGEEREERGKEEGRRNEGRGSTTLIKDRKILTY